MRKIRLYKIKQEQKFEWRFSALECHQPTKVETRTVEWFSSLPYWRTGSSFTNIDGESVYVTHLPATCVESDQIVEVDESKLISGGRYIFVG